MDALNYHHLLYFWLVVKEGGVAKAAARLRLSHPTVSAQVHTLEEQMGEKLLVKKGRQLVLTEMGTVVFGYAEEIFTLGRELMETVRGQPSDRPARLRVGVAQVVPKLIAKRLLEPVLTQGPVHLLCREDATERLLADLARHELDVVISDSPLPAGSATRAFNHLLGECGVTIVATSTLAKRLRRGFPGSLHGAPVLLPSAETTLRRSLDRWFDEHGIVPSVVGEFDDSALMKAFGQDGVGVMPVPTAVEGAVGRQYGLRVVGRIPAIRERFFAISIERRIRHPAVLTICESARDVLFA